MILISAVEDPVEIGEGLEENNLGRCFVCNASGEPLHVLYLYTIRKGSFLVFMSIGMFIPHKSSFLRELSELSDNKLGFSSRWNCKRKEEGRFDARCSYSSYMSRQASEGIRVSQSKKAG